MIYRVTRLKIKCDRKDRQGYYVEAINELMAITSFYHKYPQFSGEEIELEEWSGIK